MRVEQLRVIYTTLTDQRILQREFTDKSERNEVVIERRRELRLDRETAAA